METPKKAHDGLYGLVSKWPIALDLAGSNLPCRLEGEIADLVVMGEIPKETSGTFYRVMVDPFVPPDERNVPIDGDGNISASRFHEGCVDMNMRYKLERKAGRALFGLYRNPFTHHPCVRAAVDCTANTNLVYWAGQLLALKEVALPYALDPDTLDTVKYDPFGDQIKSKTFAAHPKVDPVTNELVVFGYEAKDLATLDVVTYALDALGQKTEELWLKAPWCGFIHDCAITTKFIVLFILALRSEHGEVEGRKAALGLELRAACNFYCGFPAPRKRCTVWLGEWGASCIFVEELYADSYRRCLGNRWENLCRKLEGS